MEDDHFWWGQLKTLKIINVKQITTTDQLCKELKIILWSLENLEFFSIRNCEIKDDLSSVIKVIPQSIKKLDIRGDFVFAFEEPIRFLFPNLENVKLSSSIKSTPMYQFRTPKLKKLDGYEFETDFVHFLKKNSSIVKKLKSIVLPSHCTSILSYLDILQNIKEIKLPLPKKRGDITLILKTFENLRSLKITNPGETPGNLVLDVFKSDNKKLQKISIENCKLSRIVEALPDLYPSLHHLELNNCDFVLASQ